VPSLFSRKTAEVAAEPPAATNSNSMGTESESPSGRRGHTPSKRERGVVTPKRSDPRGRRPAEPPAANRREANKRIRERERADRDERRKAMMAGDERYLLARDRGAERALVRDIVDCRRTMGTWFFGGALIVLFGSSNAMPPPVRLASNLLWALLALATVADSFLLARQIKKLVTERFPKTTVKLGSLYFYGVMRGITFRRMRVPRPRIALGTQP